MVDVSGNGFDLTDGPNGVEFDLIGDGVLKRHSWTKANSDDGWLALDRNGNGRIDNGTELFGTATLQPAPTSGTEKNGFLALGQYDLPQNGGNGDGLINDLDGIFSALHLWQDLNHNGISEASELRPLTQVGLKTLELNYRTSKKLDRYGNEFRYRAKVKDETGAQLGRWAWDVFLLSGQ